MPQSAFAKKFERIYRDAKLPAVYRKFIVSDAYVPFARGFVHGLPSYSSDDDIEIQLASAALLDREELWDASDIDPDDATEYHPIATIPESSQFLAIDVTKKSAPVVHWEHETGEFEPQFDTFAQFVKNLRTRDQVREARAKAKQAGASVSKAALAARKQLAAGNLKGAAAVLDAALKGKRPIEYDGVNDFDAIGELCDCFNLRGRVFLAQGRLADARKQFLKAVGCGGKPWTEALVDAVATSFLLDDIGPIVEELTAVDPDYWVGEPAAVILERNFTPVQHVRILETANGVRWRKRPRVHAAVAKRVGGWKTGSKRS